MGGLGQRELPQGMDFQWTELTLLQILAGNTAMIVFALAVVLVFLVLAAQYESLFLPLPSFWSCRCASPARTPT